MSNFVNLLDIVYPVGSVYITVNRVSPADNVGGTWEKIEDRFLKGASSTQNPSDVGGSENHYHEVMMAYPEYYGWGNITGTKEMGYAPTSGIVDIAKKLNGYSCTGDSGTTLWFKHLQPWHRGSSGTANYTAPIMAQSNALEVKNTYVNTQEGTTSIQSHLPPYYVVYMYKRTA